MRDILPQIESWRQDGRRVAVATVVKVWGSAPRPLGSKMAISDGGDMAGSVSGGCVEGAVFEEAQGVMERRQPKLVGFGVSNEDAWAVGLSCGGKIEVFIEPLVDGEGPAAALHRDLVTCLERERLVAVATVIDGPGIGRRRLVHPDTVISEDLVLPPAPLGELGSPELHHEVAGLARQSFASFRCERRRFEEGGEAAEVFLEVHPPRPRLVIVGAVHVAIPLVTFANSLGLATIVVDPRTAFATAERFPHADEIRTDWPDEALRAIGPNENTFVALLSHDLKLDVPALEVVLASPARYVGALGSKKTHAKRVKALREAGIPSEAIMRIHNPIGLDLGGRRAEEIAVAIVAEMVAVHHGKSTAPAEVAAGRQVGVIDAAGF